MRDRVADVIRERAALETSGAGGLILSVVLHAGIAAWFVYGAVQRPLQQRVAPLNIRFAPAAPAPVVRAAAPVKKPEAPRIEQPMPEPPKPVTSTAPPEKNTATPSAFGKSTKKASDNPEVRKPAPAAADGLPVAGASASPAVGVGQAGVTGLDGDFPYTGYIDRMTTLIGSHWVRNDIGAEPRAIVYFVIERDGRLRDVQLELSSGNSTFDRNAQRAVLSSNPLPPLPFGYSGTYLGVHLTFR